MKLKNYYTKLFLENYRTPDDKVDEMNNAVCFMNYCIKNADLLKPIFEWFTCIYIDGVSSEKETLLERNVERCAKNCQTRIVLIDDRIDVIMLGDFTGVFGYMFNNGHGFDKRLKLQAIEILKKIKIMSGEFSFKSVDWDFFIEECWYSMLLNVYKSILTDRNTLENCILSKVLKDKLIEYNLDLVYIDDDLTSSHHSGMGIDFEKKIVF